MHTCCCPAHEKSLFVLLIFQVKHVQGIDRAGFHTFFTFNAFEGFKEVPMDIQSFYGAGFHADVASRTFVAVELHDSTIAVQSPLWTDRHAETALVAHNDLKPFW